MRDIYYKESFHVITEAEKSKIQSEGRMTRRVDHEGSSPKFSLKAGEDQCLGSETIRPKERQTDRCRQSERERQSKIEREQARESSPLLTG